MFLVQSQRCYWAQRVYSYSFSRILLTSAVDIESGRSSGGREDLTADSLLMRTASIKGIKLTLQHGLTHDGGAPVFVACDGLDPLPHIFGVVDVEVSVLCWCLRFASLMPAFSFTLAVLYAFLSPDRKAAFLALDRVPRPFYFPVTEH